MLGTLFIVFRDGKQALHFNLTVTEAAAILISTVRDDMASFMFHPNHVGE